MTAQQDFNRIAGLMADSEANRTLSSESTFDATAVLGMTKKALSQDVLPLMVAALDAEASPEVIRHLAAHLRAGSCTAPIPDQAGRTVLSSLMDRFDVARARALQDKIRYPKDAVGLCAAVSEMVAERPDHPGLAWVLDDLLTEALQARLRFPENQRSNFWGQGPGQVFSSLLKAMDALSVTNPAAFALALKANQTGLMRLNEISDDLRTSQNKDSHFVSYPSLSALESAITASCSESLSAILRSPAADLFSSSMFRGVYGEISGAFGLPANPAAIWPASAFRFLFRHLAQHPDQATLFEEMASAKLNHPTRARMFYTNPGATRYDKLAVPSAISAQIMHRPLGDHETIYRDLSAFRFAPSNFSDRAILANFNLTEALLSKPESAALVFETWNRHPIGPLALFSSFRPTQSAAFFLANKDVLSLWRSPNGSNALHYAIAAMTPFSVSRQAMLSVLDACPDLAATRNAAGLYPSAAIQDSEILTAVNRRLLNRSVPEVVKTAAKKSSKSPATTRLM